MAVLIIKQSTLPVVRDCWFPRAKVCWYSDGGHLNGSPKDQYLASSTIGLRLSGVINKILVEYQCYCLTVEKRRRSNINYRPISNLSLISKIIERVVKSRLMDHLTSNSLLNSHQSAYCKHRSTETALLYIHDCLISAMGSQKISCLCLLDLSAAFDTIDHDILITRLSS